jgi:succinate dehydrogenase / fumarate reductase, iron-sulfur subunit
MDKVTFKVFRFDSTKDEAPRYQDYEVPVTPGLTVILGLVWIQQNLDGSLAFRSSCRAGVCGSCAMHINGRYRLACETQVAAMGSTITIRPLGHMPIVRDLITDMKPFWDKYKSIKPFLIPGAPPPEKEYVQSPDQRAKLDQVIDCILCATCYGSCTVVAMDPGYIGPAALAKAARFILDSRDHGGSERLELCSGEDGAWRCHTIFNCSKLCPRDVEPASGIAEIKRKSLWHRMGGGR